MRMTPRGILVLSAFLALYLGCASDRPEPKVAAEDQAPGSAAPEDARAERPRDAEGSPAAEEPPATKPPAAEPPPKTATSAPPADNPTTRSGRGEPSLQDVFRQAAWVYIDGEEGRFIEKDGRPQMQWMIHTPVSRNPSFRVAAYEPLLGNPRDFQAVLQTYESFDGTSIVYALRAKEGTFQVNQDYSLLKPGDDFIILDKTTNTEVAQVPPLSPGMYGLVASVRNAETDAVALAVTYFTVAEEMELPAGSQTGSADQPAEATGHTP